MGYRVEQYNLGFSIKHGSSLDAYLKIKSHFEGKAKTTFGFEKYKRLNSISTMNDMFYKLLKDRHI